jgi:hypothetical protein
MHALTQQRGASVPDQGFQSVAGLSSMIPKSVKRFSEKIMLKQRLSA